VLASGLVWITAGSYYLGGYSLINLHAFGAVALVLLLVSHVVDRRWILRVPRARDRRAFLSLGGVAIAAIVLWRLERPFQRLLELPGARRRFTGSYEDGSFSTAFPETSWLNDSPALVDADEWRLAVDGAVARPLELGYRDLPRLESGSVRAVLDCTGGWYAELDWRGVPLAAVLEQAGLEDGAESVSVESVTGYARRFSLDQARGLLLATHVSGEPLSHGHGFPLRLVVPDQRGFDWVKWIVRIRVLNDSHLIQPPLPLT
jgi:DMSO/TMAO reductase YedYZ molybdopterin-dependent catalytic subunit